MMSPFTENETESVGAIGEIGLLKCIEKWIQDVSPPPPYGMGDDCAVLTTGYLGTLLSTVDPVIYGRHFDDACPPELVGRKAMMRGLSDIAAMGGSPGPALVALTLSRNLGVSWLEAFFGGMVAASSDHGVTLVGGDVAEVPGSFFAAHVTQLGSVDRPLARNGARAGDYLFVTGELGGSILGKHLTFEARLDEGQWLARQDTPRACIDLTDGLAKDLPELLPEDTNAYLNLDTLPVSDAAHELASRDGRAPQEHAFCDGEDYEVLFAVDGKLIPAAFEAQWRERFSTPLTCIGKIDTDVSGAGGRMLINTATGEELVFAGFEHLRG